MRFITLLSITLSLMLVSSFAFATCPAGKGFNPANGGCKRCDAGYFSPANSTGACSPATRGHFVANSGASAEVACPPGTYTSEFYRTKCTKCDAGYYAAGSGAAACSAATSGNFVARMGASAQVKCPKGTYSNQPYRTACIDCKADYTTSGSGQTRCDVKIDSPSAYFKKWGKGAIGTKPGNPNKCKKGKNWKTGGQRCK